MIDAIYLLIMFKNRRNQKVKTIIKPTTGGSNFTASIGSNGGTEAPMRQRNV